MSKQNADRQGCPPRVEQTLLSAQVIAELLSAPRRIHMLGIGGIGMAGLAFLLKESGHTVSGSDTQENRQTDWLRGKGIAIQNEVPPDAEWIIRSRAVPDSHPDVRAATVRLSWRGDVLPELLRERFTIAVSGTHGKTTTTAMIAQILDCGYCIGGEVEGFDGTARDGGIMVVEADESDGTVANYHPDIAVITNIEYDHMEHHADFESFEACFRKFIEQAKEKIIYCAEDPVATRLCEKNPKAVGYQYPISNNQYSISLPGRHNLLNAMAAVEVCKQWLSEEIIWQRLETLHPVKRRFEVVHQGEYTVISDYAHHPTEIRALIDTAFETLKPKRLLGVFQPHRYTRTLALGPDFPPAFQGLEKLWLLPVYAASEEPIEGGTTADLIKKFPESEKMDIKFFQTLEKTWQDVQCELCAGDVLLIIGAGDIEKIGEWSKGVKERGDVGVSE
ncbi:MAG: UDP-N-acetylmuramate--L-alanine ligase [Kiritimatiellales bacterium]|nr:UDP-N-acetylmuramate--L-alanine ligase [Kiritimatiellota bacterium]MBL7011893.1 UDP-N-acetylmuramate--L-alanine ligase [Kiritimatiellales bacterium]